MLSIRDDRPEDVAWHLLLCRPNQNHIAARSLARLDADLFMPWHRTTRRWRGRVSETLAPVFAGYAFVGISPARPNWSALRTAPGVARIVSGQDGQPARVPRTVVDGLMRRCDYDGVLRPDYDLKSGDRGRGTCGPFAEFVSTVESIDADHRVWLLLDMLGGTRRVQVDQTMLRRRA